MMIKTLPDSWLPQVRFYDTATVVRKQKPRICAESTSMVAKLEPKIGSCRISNGRKDFTMANYQIHQTAVFYAHQRTKVRTTSSIREPSLIEPTIVTNGPKQVRRPQHKRGLKCQINHGKVIGNSMGGGIPKTCGTHQSTTIGWQP